MNDYFCHWVEEWARNERGMSKVLPRAAHPEKSDKHNRRVHASSTEVRTLFSLFSRHSIQARPPPAPAIHRLILLSSRSPGAARCIGIGIRRKEGAREHHPSPPLHWKNKKKTNNMEILHYHTQQMTNEMKWLLPSLSCTKHELNKKRKKGGFFSPSVLFTYIFMIISS